MPKTFHESNPYAPNYHRRYRREILVDSASLHWNRGLRAYNRPFDEISSELAPEFVAANPDTRFKLFLDYPQLAVSLIELGYPKSALASALGFKSWWEMADWAFYRLEVLHYIEYAYVDSVDAVESLAHTLAIAALGALPDAQIPFLLPSIIRTPYDAESLRREAQRRKQYRLQFDPAICV